MWPWDIKRNERDTKPAQHRLTFAADVEQFRVKGDRNGQTREDKIRRIIERVTPPIG